MSMSLPFLGRRQWLSSFRRQINLFTCGPRMCCGVSIRKGHTIRMPLLIRLPEMLLRGFTTVRDTGGASKSLASAIAEGLIPGPRLFQCGKALSQTGQSVRFTSGAAAYHCLRTCTGGHADFGPSSTSNTGCCGGHTQALGRTCDGVPQVLKATREELKGGADFIKIMCGGGVASPTVRMRMLGSYASRQSGDLLKACYQNRMRLRLCSSQLKRFALSRRHASRWGIYTVRFVSFRLCKMVSPDSEINLSSYCPRIHRRVGAARY